MSSAILRIERAIFCVLQPMTGPRSIGTAIVKATGAPIAIPAGSYAIPIPVSGGGSSQLDYDRMVKTGSATVGANPPTDTLVDSGGTSVPIFSIVGGKNQDLDPGTRLLWSPGVIGVEPISVVDASGTTGGASLIDPSAVLRIATIEGVSSADFSIQAFRAGVGNFPALILSWMGATPGTKTGISRTFQAHTFRIYGFVDRFDGKNQRRDEGKEIMDEVRRNLIDRADVDGEVFAAPPIRSGASGRLVADGKTYVHWFEFTVPHTTIRNERRVYNDWLTTREQLVTMTDADHPDPTDALVQLDQSQTMT